MSPAVFVLVMILGGAAASPPESRLIKDLMRGYVTQERPVIDSQQPVIVTLGVVMQQIIDLNEKDEQMTINAWLKYHWNDANLRWNPEQYENVSDIRYPAGSIWQPDVLLYNSVDSVFDSTYKVNLLAYSNGIVNWIPPGIFKISCKLDIYWFPFDEQVCFLKFGSWSFSGRQIDLQPGEFDFSEFMENGEWVILNSWVNRTEKYYDCCPEPYPDVKFFLHLRRRTLYYAFNLVMPCMLTMVLVLLGFTLSSDSCEKIGLQITVSLAITIFLTIMNSMTPATSEAVPLLGVFFFCCMVLSVTATAFTVYVQSFHFKSHKNHKRMGFWMRYILLEWIPYILRIKLPKRANNLHTLAESWKLRHRKNDIRAAFTYKNGTCQIFSALASSIKDNFNSVISELSSKSKTKKDVDMAERLRLLNKIYEHIKMIRESNDDDYDDQRIRYEWQFAAIVVDRLGLILFSVLLLITTLTIVLRAPYLVA
ncbi:hypothetical protein QR680_003956 [Steinernema hermaphroditum]|uniref:Uncharacterized protein n=1 Tax=Steinernema hermaphroditum TaxID=289476 RepID=A0AA39LSG3_9BILA|nr:hypothetical protein QR680_003956 [Steinernema hermaphroditum]